MQGPVNWRAAFLGGAVAIAASAFFGTLVANITLWVLVLRGVPLEQAYADMWTSISSILIGEAVTILCNAAGGYAAASLASTRFVVHSFLAGAMNLVFGVIAYATPMPTAANIPFWMVIWNFMVPVPAALLGGYIYARRA